MITENIIVNKEFSWIDIERPHRPEFSFLNKEFHLPQLYLQDCVRIGQLPKYEKGEKLHFFLLRSFDPTSLDYDLTVQKLTNKLAIFVFSDRLIGVHDERLQFLRKLADDRESPELSSGPYKLLHKIIKECVLTYEAPIRSLQRLYEKFEGDILSENGGQLSMKWVFLFRRRLFILKGVLQMTMSSIKNSKEFWSEKPALLQDIIENIDQLYFRLDGLSHNFDQLFALHLSINDRKNNDVMKILTVFASIMLPLTFIASFYGMNFTNLPGLHTTSGLIGAMILMAVISFSTIWYFNKKHWFKSSL